MDRKPGALLKIFGDFWLGMAGAGASGFAKMAELRRAEKDDPKEHKDFYQIATEGAVTAFADAVKTVARTKADLVQEKAKEEEEKQEKEKQGKKEHQIDVVEARPMTFSDASRTAKQTPKDSHKE